MTALRLLRDEYELVKAETPRRSYRRQQAFENLFRAAAKEGQPLDALRRYTADEGERFFAQTIPGIDGHVYWDGWVDRFKRNDGKTRVPRRWWWAHVHGAEPGYYEDIVPTCGELNCINPEHCEQGRGLRRQRFTTEQMLGAIRVAALRLGRAPVSTEWDGLGLKPSRTLYKLRFGTWGNAIRSAGLEYVHSHDGGYSASPADCIEAIRHVRKALGHWPTVTEFRASGELLGKANLPTDRRTVMKHLGPWHEALRKAGKR